MSKNPAHPLHPVYDDGKGGGWKWWECHFVLLNSHISAYARCLAGKVCGPVRSTWGTSLGEDTLGARDSIHNTKVVRRANIPPLPRTVCTAVSLFSTQLRLFVVEHALSCLRIRLTRTLTFGACVALVCFAIGCVCIGLHCVQG